MTFRTADKMLALAIVWFSSLVLVVVLSKGYYLGQLRAREARIESLETSIAEVEKRSETWRKLATGDYR